MTITQARDIYQQDGMCELIHEMYDQGYSVVDCSENMEDKLGVFFNPKCSGKYAYVDDEGNYYLIASFADIINLNILDTDDDDYEYDDDDEELDHLQQLKALYDCEPGDLTLSELLELEEAGMLDD